MAAKEWGSHLGRVVGTNGDRKRTESVIRITGFIWAVQVAIIAEGQSTHLEFENSQKQTVVAWGGKK